MTALAVRNLRVTYPGPPAVQAVDGLSFDIDPGECVGILGESGSGKSTLAQTLLGLLPEARVEGTVHLGGTELTALDEDGWREVRWRRISLGFQSPTALNPVLRIGDQLSEPLRVHLGMSKQEAAAKVTKLLESVTLGGWATPPGPVGAGSCATPSTSTPCSTPRPGSGGFSRRRRASPSSCSG